MCDPREKCATLYSCFWLVGHHQQGVAYLLSGVTELYMYVNVYICIYSRIQHVNTRTDAHYMQTRSHMHIHAHTYIHNNEITNNIHTHTLVQIDTTEHTCLIYDSTSDDSDPMLLTEQVYSSPTFQNHSHLLSVWIQNCLS